MEEKNKTFTYTYSAAQQEEVKRIREKYAPPTQEEDKMERLRRLDASVTRPGMIAALVIGIIKHIDFGHWNVLHNGMGRNALCTGHHYWRCGYRWYLCSLPTIYSHHK